MTDADKIATIREALDQMGLALTDHDHQWSPELRRAFDKADRLLTKMEKLCVLGPSWDDLEAWRDAPSGTASAGPNVAEARKLCKREGHLPRTVSWYSREQDYPQPCRRGCGVSVMPRVSMSGHP